MVTSKDKYLRKLDSLAESMENLCGLYTLASDNEPYCKKGIIEVINFMNGHVKSLSAEEQSSINIANGKIAVLVTYISCRLTFYQKLRLDYSVYPCMDIVAGILIDFRKKNTITEDSLRDVNKIVYVLSQIDEHYVNYRYSLGYRYLRLIIIFITYGNYCNAGALVSFVLEQLTIEGA